MTSLDRLEVCDAGCAPLIIAGAEPGQQDLCCQIVSERAVGQAQDVGVIPDASASGLTRIGTEGGAHARNLFAAMLIPVPVQQKNTP